MANTSRNPSSSTLFIIVSNLTQASNYASGMSAQLMFMVLSNPITIYTWNGSSLTQL